MGILKDQPEKTERLKIDRSWSKSRKKNVGLMRKCICLNFIRLRVGEYNSEPAHAYHQNNPCQIVLT